MTEANTLQKITLPIVSTRECRNAYLEYLGDEAKNNAQVYLDRNICAGGEDGIQNFESFKHF